MKKVLNSKKLSYITRSCMILLTTVLIILFFFIMLLVGQIQGTARVLIMQDWCVVKHSVL